MGAGKTRVGKRLSEILGVPFVDSDQEIERETGRTISELFAVIGEAAFREGERKMMTRLLNGPVAVIAAGGGAFMNAETRANIQRLGIGVWLRADLETLVSRTARSHKRPLLEGVDKATRLAELMQVRYPLYAEAELVVDSQPGPVENTVSAVLAALRSRECSRRSG